MGFMALIGKQQKYAVSLTLLGTNYETLLAHDYLRVYLQSAASKLYFKGVATVFIRDPSTSTCAFNICTDLRSRFIPLNFRLDYNIIDTNITNGKTKLN